MIAPADRAWVRSQLPAIQAALNTGDLDEIQRVLNRVIAEAENPDAVRDQFRQALQEAR